MITEIVFTLMGLGAAFGGCYFLGLALKINNFQLYYAFLFFWLAGEIFRALRNKEWKKR